MTSAFVHIIESPSSEDLLEDRTEGRCLSEALRLAGIPRTYSMTANLEALRAALGPRLALAIREYRVPPILHFSAHGNAEGIGLTDGEILSWQNLSELLHPIHDLIGIGALICLSSCEGASGIRMAMTDGPEQPFFALVSHCGKPTWSDCAVAYIAFYNRLFKGHQLDLAVQAMRAATGDPNFAYWNGQKVKQGWLNRARQALAQNLAAENPYISGLHALGLPPNFSSNSQHPCST